MSYGDSIVPDDVPLLLPRERSLDRACSVCYMHGQPFYTNSSRCVPCQQEYWRNWARKNRDKTEASRKRRLAAARALAAHKDRVLLRLARDDPERFAEVWAEEGP